MFDVPHSHPTRLEGLSIVLPCLDEAENIAAVIGAATTAARSVTDDYEVIVVDDGSTDATGAIAREIAERDPRVVVVSHPANRGYGAAVRSGIDASRLAWVLLTDADGQFDFSDLPRFVIDSPDYDMLAGYRAHRQDPWHRRVAAAAWKLLVRRSFGVNLHDIDCAFKLVRGDRLRSLKLSCDGAMLPTELLVRAMQDHWRIAELSVHHLPRLAGRSTGGNPRVALRALRERHAFSQDLRAVKVPLSARVLPSWPPLF